MFFFYKIDYVVIRAQRWKKRTQPRNGPYQKKADLYSVNLSNLLKKLWPKRICIRESLEVLFFYFGLLYSCFLIFFKLQGAVTKKQHKTNKVIHKMLFKKMVRHTQKKGHFKPKNSQKKKSRKMKKAEKKHALEVVKKWEKYHKKRWAGKHAKVTSFCWLFCRIQNFHFFYFVSSNLLRLLRHFSRIWKVNIKCAVLLRWCANKACCYGWTRLSWNDGKCWRFIRGAQKLTKVSSTSRSPRPRKLPRRALKPRRKRRKKRRNRPRKRRNRQRSKNKAIQ